MKEVQGLGKQLLEIIEDLQQEHKQNFYKLFIVMADIQKDIKAKYGVEIALTTFVSMADYFDDAKYQFLRKRILDKTNDTIRSIQG